MPYLFLPSIRRLTERAFSRHAEVSGRLGLTVREEARFVRAEAPVSGMPHTSEAPPGALPTRKRFLSRNRLEVAVLGATVVVEAGARSNSLATAHRAHGLGRVVGAVPGPVTSPSSAGPRQLITDGRAMLTSDARQWLVGTGPCERWVHDGSATAARPCVRPGTVPRLARVRCHE